jgi:hypothetical protein
VASFAVQRFTDDPGYSAHGVDERLKAGGLKAEVWLGMEDKNGEAAKSED